MRLFLYVLIALSFALLAYTQKSTCTELDTDVVRYYAVADSYKMSSLSSLLSTISFIEFSYFLFTALSMIVVSTFNNVQYLSLFWVFVSYIFYFLSLENYIKAKGISLSRKQYFILLFISIFGFILFPINSEILKQAAATSIFFYGFTSFLVKDYYKCVLCVLSSIFINVSVIMLFPIFTFKKITNIQLSILAVVSIVLAQINIMDILSGILTGSFLSPIAIKATTYAGEMQGFSTSIRYIMLATVLLVMIFWSKYINVKCEMHPNKYLNIGFLYLVILLLNYRVGHNFIRYVNMSYCIYSFMFLEVLHGQVSYNMKKIKKAFVNILFVAFIFTNFQMTYARTLGGGYTSAYMDNNLFRIIFSSIYDYLNYVAY